MATLFGTDATTLAEPRGAGARPIQGVQTPASPVTLPTGLMDIGVQVARDVLKKEQLDMKQATEAGQRSLLADYTRSRTSIANSNLSLQEKTARMNALDSQFQIAATEMGILDDFKKSRDLMTSGGITGAIDTQAKAQRESYQKNVDFLRQNDVIVPPGAPDDYVQALLENHAKRETLIKDYRFLEEQNKNLQGNIKFDQSQADRINQENATSALNQIAGVSLESFNIQAKAISDSVLSGEKTEEEARAELIALEAKHVGVINSMSSNSPQQASVWREQYQSLIKGHLDIVTNRDSSGQRTINRQINTSALLAAQNNPELLRLASLNPYLGDNTLASQLAGNTVAARLIPKIVGTNLQDTGVKGTNIIGDADNKGAELTTYAFVREGLSQVRAGSADPEAKEGYFRAANNLLTMLGAKNPGELSAVDLKDVAGFMLSPEFVYMVKEGGLNPSAASSASRVFKQVYGEAIDGEIREALSKPLPLIGGTGLGGRSIYPEGVEKYSDVVDVKFQDGRVQFLPKANLEQTTAQGNTGAIMRYIKSSLRDQEKALNQNIKLGAHLEGTTNYQQFWEDNKAALMPYMYADPTRVERPVTINGVTWEYIGPPGGRTDSPENWRRVDGGN